MIQVLVSTPPCPTFALDLFSAKGESNDGWVDQFEPTLSTCLTLSDRQKTSACTFSPKSTSLIPASQHLLPLRNTILYNAYPLILPKPLIKPNLRQFPSSWKWTMTGREAENKKNEINLDSDKELLSKPKKRKLRTAFGPPKWGSVWRKTKQR